MKLIISKMKQNYRIIEKKKTEISPNLDTGLKCNNNIQLQL